MQIVFVFSVLGTHSGVVAQDMAVFWVGSPRHCSAIDVNSQFLDYCSGTL